MIITIYISFKNGKTSGTNLIYILFPVNKASIILFKIFNKTDMVFIQQKKVGSLIILPTMVNELNLVFRFVVRLLS